MSGPPHGWRALREHLALAGVAGAVALGAPLLALVDLSRRARLRRLLGRATWTHLRALRLESEVLVLESPASVDRIGLEGVASVAVWHVTGDAGFADANTETYLVRVVLREGRSYHLVLRESFPHPFASVVLAPLCRRGLAPPPTRVPGPLRGLGAALVHGLALCWCAAAWAYLHARGLA